MTSSEPNSFSNTSASLEKLDVEEVAAIMMSLEPEVSAAVPVAGLPFSPPIATSPIVANPPIIGKLRKNSVSGRYRGYSRMRQLELRVDVDGYRPMNKLSGDFYSVSGATTAYFGSFIVDNVSLTVTDKTVTISGTARTTYTTNYTEIVVTIPRTLFFVPRAAATVAWSTPRGIAGPTYVCSFESIYFRTVWLEQDYEQNVTGIFSSYNTGSLPSGGPARTLTVAGAFGEAGVEILASSAVDLVPTAEAGSNAKWSDSELHASMVKHFSMWKDEPQWKVWQLSAFEHDDQPGWITYGIMFDYQQGKQRQGCAVFYKGIGGSTSDKLRQQLYTHVHELGHCFNLFHSWQKSYTNPPGVNVPADLSWMNYDWKYPSGAAAFWNAFAFQFDDLETIHIRHDFRNNVIMGGNDFGAGAALETPVDTTAFASNTEDKSGLQLELESPKVTFEYGEPVVVELKLGTTDARGKNVHTFLHPNMGFVALGIRNPSGHITQYKPLFEHYALPNMVTLNEENPKIYDSAYVGYGSDGFYFSQPGFYQLRGVYFALDGSAIVSNILKVNVRSPKSAEDEDVARLFFGDEQGTLLQLLGSDSEYLKNGNDAFDQAIEGHPDHLLTTYARFIKGYNKGRGFKTVEPEKKKISLRKPDPNVAASLLTPVIDASAAGKGLDNISLNMTMRHLATVQSMAGKEKEAEATMKRMVDIFAEKKLKPHVMKSIKKQANETLLLRRLR